MAPEPLQPHETPQFHNAAEYVVAVTFTVAGGARPRTAERRAERVAERLANDAARAADVVEVSAVTGRSSSDGTMLFPRQVHFAAANTGHATYADPHKLDRYLDHEHEARPRVAARGQRGISGTTGGRPHAALGRRLRQRPPHRALVFLSIRCYSVTVGRPREVHDANSADPRS